MRHDKTRPRHINIDLHTKGRPFDIVRGHHVAFTAEVVMGEIAASACVSKVPMARPLSDQLVVFGELNCPGFLDAPDIPGGLKGGSNRGVTRCPINVPRHARTR